MASSTHSLIEQGPATSGKSWVRPRSASVSPATAVFALACLLHVTGWQLGPGMQVALLAIAIFIALPHGGTDLVVAGRLFRPRWGWAWLPIFGLAYLLPAGMVAFTWSVWPGWALAAFLSLSALHFGLSDTVGQRNDRRWAVPAWGGAPIIIPALAHPGEVAKLFNVLTGTAGADIVGLLRSPLAISWAVLTVIYVARLTMLSRLSGRPVLEFAAMCAGLALLPPLLAFAIYFGLLHAPRALTTRAAELRLEPRRLLLFAAGPSIAAALAAFAAYLILSTAMRSFDAAITALFVGLASLTVPHMLFDVVVARVRR